jgi:pyridoxal phosphate enzyme (YggS family)
VGTDERRAELVGALGAVRNRIAAGCAAAGRDPHEITLVAVTKTYPAHDVVTLARLGVHDVGESRDQEAAAKAAAVAAALGPDERPRWHFVGRLQSRKCRSVAGYAAAVHSLDRPVLVDRLAAAVRDAQRPPLDVFVQVSLDGDPERGGVPGDGVAALADAVAAAAQLRLRGLMAVAPLGTDPDVAFEQLLAQSERLRERHPGADAISAGMSTDLEAALRHGATHVRVGSALLGRRPPLIR